MSRRLFATGYHLSAELEAIIFLLLTPQQLHLERLAPWIPPIPPTKHDEAKLTLIPPNHHSRQPVSSPLPPHEPDSIRYRSNSGFRMDSVGRSAFFAFFGLNFLIIFLFYNRLKNFHKSINGDST